MKLQHLIILFLVIMLPLALIMSEYTSLQIDTLAKKTKYDTALLGATFDTMAAFELNTRSSETSSVPGEEIRDLEAMISTFTNSLSTSLDITGVSDEYIMSYVPAMVFTLYDGYYIYAINEVSGEKELRPYVYYTKTYTNITTSTNITISYSLDNYVSIYGTYDGNEISAAGYLVVPSDIEISPNFTYVTREEPNRSVKTYVIDPGTEASGAKSWIKYKNIDITPETIYENEPIEETRGVVNNRKENTTDAMMYYYEAKKFTELYNSIVRKLSLNDQRVLEITPGNDPENEEALFLNEKINVMKDSITKNLNAAIYNYDGAVAINYEMPQLNGEDWDKILNDVAIIAFMKNMTIGTTTYNNYVVVNSTTNKKYVSAKSIDFIAYDDLGNSKGYYHNITCDSLIQNIANGDNVIGYPSVDFKRHKYSPEDENAYYYYYKHNEYADYSCEVKAGKRENVATIQGVISGKGLSNDVKEKVLKTYYTSVGRIRYRLVKASSYINMTDKEKNFEVNYNVNGVYDDSGVLIYSGNWPDGASNNRPVMSEYGKIRVNQDEPRITGYKFIGWGTKKTLTVPDIKTGDVLYLEDNKTLDLYAIYSKQYTVTYQYEDGVIDAPSPKIQTKMKDENFIIPKKAPKMENKVFKGWDDPSTPDNVLDYPAGLEYIFSENRDLVLNAEWANETVNITYVANGQAETIPVERNTLIGLINPADIWWYSPTGKIPIGWSKVYNDVTPEFQFGESGEKYLFDRDITLHLVETVITYKITYWPNGGTWLKEGTNTTEPWEESRPHGSPFYEISTRELTRIDGGIGYEFLGWASDPNADIGEYMPGEYLPENENGDKNFYAIWEGPTYRILYDANGGSDAPPDSAPIPKTQVEDERISGIEPKREGHEFVGWSTNKFANEFEVEYYSNDPYTGRTTIKLYAIWRKEKYTIKFMANGEEIVGADKEKKFGEPVYLTLTPQQEPTKEGYEFWGWSEIDDGLLDYLPWQPFNNDSLAVNGIIRLYAVWRSNDENVYSIEYWANGGENPPEGGIIEPGETSIKIPSVAPTRTGYTFLGWSTNQGATEADRRFARNTYCSIDVVKENAGADNVLILYAVWKPNALTLTVDPDGGTWKESTAVQTLTLSAGAEMELEPVSKNGLYSYWQVVEGDATVEVIIEDNKIAKQVIKMGVYNSKIKPVWTGMYYNIYFSKNSTDSSIAGMPDPIRAQYQNNTTLPLNVPTRTSYTFRGWASTSTATTAQYKAKGTYYLNQASDVTLYAVWLANSYTITYNANGGTGAPDPQTKTHGVNLTLSSKAPTKNGYIFDGWATSSTATTAQYQPGGTYTANANATLYAVWKTIEVTGITLNKTTDQWIPNNGSTLTITATVSPSNATNKTVTWTSSNTSVATVSGGIVTAKGAGVTTITATAGGKSASVKVYVYTKPDKNSTHMPSDIKYGDKVILKTEVTSYHKILYSTNSGIVNGYIWISATGENRDRYKTYGFDWT